MPFRDLRQQIPPYKFECFTQHAGVYSTRRQTGFSTRAIYRVPRVPRCLSFATSRLTTSQLFGTRIFAILMRDTPCAVVRSY